MKREFSRDKHEHEMKITFNSPVILTFSFLCVGVYLLNHGLGLLSDQFVLRPVWQMNEFGWYFRLFSNTLGHANAEHLIGNLMYVLLLGPLVEEKYGSKKMVLMLVATAFICSIIHLTFSPYALLGASGIVFMLILIASLVNIKTGEIPITFILIVILYIGKEILGMFQDDNISHTTHIVGGIVGAIFGFMLTGRPGSGSKKLI
jgi:GlpG protein